MKSVCMTIMKKGVLITRVTPAGQNCYPRMDFLAWGCACARSEIPYLGVLSGEGLPGVCFFTALILTVGSYQGSYSAIKPQQMLF